MSSYITSYIYTSHFGKLGQSNCLIYDLFFFNLNPILITIPVRKRMNMSAEALRRPRIPLICLYLQVFLRQRK
jgi:hypothetical protein